jgi:hypothetical protein
MQDPTQAAQGQQQQIQYKGKVSDVWETKVEKGKDEDKVVLIETDIGQTILANLGPEDQLNIELEEGMPANVTGTMMYMEAEGTRRFVPHQVQVGKQATTSPAQAVPAAQVKEPQKQKVTGKVVDKEKMSAKSTKVDQQLVVVEVDPRTRVLVDLGPAAPLKNLKLEEGDRVQIEGQQTSINERKVLTADKVQAAGKQVAIQRTAAPVPKSVTPAPGEPPSQAPQTPRQPVTP